MGQQREIRGRTGSGKDSEKVEGTANRRLEPEEYRHFKCGGTVYGNGSPMDEADCPICEGVRADFKANGLNRASAGTALARELGLKVRLGKVGMAPGS